METLVDYTELDPGVKYSVYRTNAPDKKILEGVFDKFEDEDDGHDNIDIHFKNVKFANAPETYPKLMFQVKKDDRVFKKDPPVGGSRKSRHRKQKRRKTRRS